MEAAPSKDPMLTARLRVPEHVVYRDFGDETVVLNLDSGRYHGLNPTAAAMLSAVNDAETVGAAVGPLATELGQPAELIERDLLELCRSLADRGLVERDDGDAG
jgi:Coenzyme PQQ synthesis protein D (PqqD)